MSSSLQYACLGKTSYTHHSSLATATDEQIEDMIIRYSEELCAQQPGYLSSQVSASLALSAATGSFTTSFSTAAPQAHDASAITTTMDVSAEDPFAGISASPGDRFIQSQDSYFGDSYNYLDTDNEASRDAFSVTTGAATTTTANNGTRRLHQPLERGDIIIDRMHIHYGKKRHNPVNYMRFYPKGANPHTHIAQPVDETIYQTLLPRVFEELAVRVFCRNPRKESIAAKAFKMFCNKENTHQPFPSQSQPFDALGMDLDEEGEEDEELL